jgi:hypothetical protein
MGVVMVVEEVQEDLENHIQHSVSGCYTASPLATPTPLPVSPGAYPITVGGGGAPVVW